MTGENASAQVRRGLSYVCENLDALDRHLAELGRTDALVRLRRAIVDRTEDVQAPLDVLDELVRRDGDARGAYGTGVRTVPEPSPVGTGAAAEADVAFLCPLGTCARVVWAERTMQEPPLCRVASVPLRWVKR
ncbi:hypothetical protein [Streptomyces sp. WG7]|uniref:hypothetical protein n=1 Tax=Streptomyces sp. WG7 TaxID=3417650 RepID=UPI003CEC4226